MASSRDLFCAVAASASLELLPLDLFPFQFLLVPTLARLLGVMVVVMTAPCLFVTIVVGILGRSPVMVMAGRVAFTAPLAPSVGGGVSRRRPWCSRRNSGRPRTRQPFLVRAHRVSACVMPLRVS